MDNFIAMDLPGEYRDLTCNDIAAVYLAASFVAAECFEVFADWCAQFYPVRPTIEPLMTAMGRVDRLWTELDADPAARVRIGHD